MRGIPKSPSTPPPLFLGQKPLRRSTSMSDLVPPTQLRTAQTRSWPSITEPFRPTSLNILTYLNDYVSLIQESRFRGSVMICKQDTELLNRSFGGHSKTTLYQWCSAGKLLTISGILMLASNLPPIQDRSNFNLESKVGAIFTRDELLSMLGERQDSDLTNISNISVIDLITHKSGILAGPPGDSLHKLQHNQTKKGSFQYANLGYILLGEIARKVSKHDTFNTFIKAKILDPARIDMAKENTYTEPYRLFPPGADITHKGIEQYNEPVPAWKADGGFVSNITDATTCLMHVSEHLLNIPANLAGGISIETNLTNQARSVGHNGGFPGRETNISVINTKTGIYFVVVMGSAPYGINIASDLRHSLLEDRPVFTNFNFSKALHAFDGDNIEEAFRLANDIFQEERDHSTYHRDLLGVLYWDRLNENPQLERNPTYIQTALGWLKDANNNIPDDRKELVKNAITGLQKKLEQGE